MAKAVSVYELLEKKFDRIPLTGRFRDLIGFPESNGTWFLKGASGHGKTSFLMALCKELTKYGKVAYNTLEEGARASMQDALIDFKMHQCPKGSFIILNREPIPEMIARLKKKQSPDFVVIDSIQYTFMTLKDYKQMQKELPKKLFIINSHKEGKQAVGALAKRIEFDADVKLDAEGYLITSKSRAARGIITKPFVVWEEGAKKYHNDLIL